MAKRTTLSEYARSIGLSAEAFRELLLTEMNHPYLAGFFQSVVDIGSRHGLSGRKSRAALDAIKNKAPTRPAWTKGDVLAVERVLSEEQAASTVVATEAASSSQPVVGAKDGTDEFNALSAQIAASDITQPAVRSNRNDLLKLHLVTLSNGERVIVGSPFRSPARVTSGPSANRNGRPHHGVDMVPTGSDWTVHSLTGGVVTEGVMKGYGNFVAVFDGTHTYLYTHLADRAVKTGSVIEAGAALGKMGSSGRSSGAHLHLEVRSGNHTYGPGNALTIARMKEWVRVLQSQ